MAEKRMDDLTVYEVKLTTKQTLSLRRMSEREIDTFMKQDWPWILEQSQKLLDNMNKTAYAQYCGVLEEAVIPLVADRDRKTGESESANLIKLFKDDALNYRFDAFNLPKAILRNEGLDGSKRRLPTEEEVDEMSDEEVLAAGESSPPSSRAKATSRSGSPAATPSAGRATSTATKRKTSKTSRAR